jgi:hypothetical protein
MSSSMTIAKVFEEILLFPESALFTWLGLLHLTFPLKKGSMNLFRTRILFFLASGIGHLHSPHMHLVFRPVAVLSLHFKDIRKESALAISQANYSTLNQSNISPFNLLAITINNLP